jgi:hypothetical protein
MGQTNNDILYILCPWFCIFCIVEINFNAPKIDADADKCKLKTVRSSAAPEWLCIALRGGYTVQHVLLQFQQERKQIRSIVMLEVIKTMLLRRGNAITWFPIMICTNQLSKPSISRGITIKYIIRKALAVIRTLCSWWLPSKKWLPIKQFHSN